MKEQLLLLYRLQETDSQTQADQTEVAGLDDGGRLATELEGEEAVLDELQQKLASTEAELHNKQLELQGTEDERKRKWDQAYGGRVSAPRELTALEQKIEELDRRTDRLEEEIIMLLDDVETLQAQVTEKQAEVDKMSSRLDEVRTYFAQRSAALAADLAGLTQQRTELAGQIGSGLLAEYERLRQRIGDIAVAVVEKHACRACHTAVADSLLRELRDPSRVVKCESCRRILVLDKWI